MEKIELNLDNPIFVFYVDVSNMSRQQAHEIIIRQQEAFNVYTNITNWIIASDRTEVVCIYDGKYRNKDKELTQLIEEINTRIDILSESSSFEDFKLRVRDWRLENILPKDGTE